MPIKETEFSFENSHINGCADRNCVLTHLSRGMRTTKNSFGSHSLLEA
ncbi:hypothetical protein [Treponema lecithinolyticum]|nr:hypothetical protein [Treponema lecithinolyticum]